MGCACCKIIKREIPASLAHLNARPHLVWAAPG
jgi:hypothetical protein